MDNMKTMVDKSVKFMLLIIMLAGTTFLNAAQSVTDNGYVTVNGIVKNKDNNKRVEYANILVKGTNVGTVANENGEFTLKVKNILQARMIVVSHVGYVSNIINLTGSDMNNLTVWMTPQNNVLHEVIIRAGDARDIVKDAIRKISFNYESNNCLLSGFYRETVRKRQRYINITEAVVGVYKTSYMRRSADNDRVQVIKGRKLLSEKSGDTLAVKLLGGPNMSVYVDVVKNPDVLLDEESLSYYKFKEEEPVYIDHRLQYVISFQPQVNLPYALYNGKMYIDSENLSFTHVELSLDMNDRNKATQAILKKKPFGLVFKPQELTFLINYKERDGKMCLDYIRNEVRFKCDWKRKLFSTGYTVVSEMVVTDLKSHDFEKIPYRASFSEHDSFTDKVDASWDGDFWGAYNIIAPTESLDKAVNKLKK
jgi:hypothetical protein